MVCPYRLNCRDYEPYSRCRITYKLCKTYNQQKQKENDLLLDSSLEPQSKAGEGNTQQKMPVIADNHSVDTSNLEKISQGYLWDGNDGE